MNIQDRLSLRKRLGISALELEFIELINAYSIDALGYCPLSYADISEMLNITKTGAKNIGKKLTDLKILTNKNGKLCSQLSLPTGQESLPVGQNSLPVGQESLPVGQESLPVLESSSHVRTGLDYYNIINNNKLLLEEEIIKEEKKEKQAKEKQQEKEKPNRKPRGQPTPIFPLDYDPELKEAVLGWLNYKTQRKEFYVDEGIKALIQKTLKFPKQEVLDAIITAKSNHSQGFYLKSTQNGNATNLHHSPKFTKKPQPVDGKPFGEFW